MGQLKEPPSHESAAAAWRGKTKPRARRHPTKRQRHRTARVIDDPEVRIHAHTSDKQSLADAA